MHLFPQVLCSNPLQICHVFSCVGLACANRELVLPQVSAKLISHILKSGWQKQQRAEENKKLLLSLDTTTSSLFSSFSSTPSATEKQLEFVR